MERIYDRNIIEQYIRKYNINKLLNTENLDFFLSVYQKGEIVISPDEDPQFLFFIIEGTLMLYSLKSDGSQYLLSAGKTGFEQNPIPVLGDMEFALHCKSRFFVVTQTDVTALCLHREGNRKRLEQDPQFLMYLLRAAAQKAYLSTQDIAVLTTLEERLLDYLKHRTTDQTIHKVQDICYPLHCSRRQLQRILKSLTEQGILEHTGKGTYHLK